MTREIRIFFWAVFNHSVQKYKQVVDFLLLYKRTWSLGPCEPSICYNIQCETRTDVSMICTDLRRGQDVHALRPLRQEAGELGQTQ